MPIRFEGVGGFEDLGQGGGGGQLGGDPGENGDGVVDATAKADNQTAVMFFRGANGQRYGLELIDNPTLRAKSVATFMAGARTMQ